MEMRCHVCNVAVGDGQRFCHECGESLDGVTNPTEPLDVVPDAATVVVASEAVDAAAIDTTQPTIEYSEPDEGADLTTADLADAAAPSGSSAGAAAAAVAASSERVEPPSIDEPAPVGPSDPGWWADEPPPPAVDDPFAPTAPLDEAVAPDADPAFTPTQAMGVVGVGTAATNVGDMPTGQMSTPPAPAAEPVAAYDVTTAMPAAAGTAPRALGDTDELPGQVAAAPLFDGVDDVDEYTVPPSEGFRLRASFVLGFLATVATLMASIADVIDIRTSRPVDGISVGIRTLEDFGTNLPVAGFVGAAVMLIGGLLSCFGLRSGAGLAGGAGLALAGWAAMTIGLVEVPIHSAEGITRNTGANVNGFELAITRDLGYFLIAAIGVLGAIVFATTLRMAGSGGRPGLNPWIAALGALGAVILAAGPLIPLGEATADLNLGFVGLPRAFFAGRLVQLSLIAFTGIVGFLSVRTYGLGLAGGGVSIATWLWVTSLAEVGDQPVSVAVGNLGTLETTPHAVTTVGLALSLVMLVIAAALAIVKRPRRM